MISICSFKIVRGSFYFVAKNIYVSCKAESPLQDRKRCIKIRSSASEKSLNQFNFLSTKRLSIALLIKGTITI